MVIVALGTRGDVEPAVRLGVALRHRGDHVVVASLADGAGHIERAGLSPLVVGPESATVMWWSRAWARDVAVRQPGAMYLQTRTRLARHADAVAAVLAPVVARADLVVCGLAAAGVVPVLLRAGVPARLVLHAPLVPHPEGTSAWSSGWSDLIPRPVEAQRQTLMWGLTQGLSSALARALARRLRGSGGRPGEPGRARRAAALPPLLSTSPVLDPRPSPDLLQTGWWADPTPVRPLSAEVTAWLAAHPDAVLLGLGSIAQEDPEDQVGWLVEVARRTGVPTLVQVTGATPGPRPVQGRAAALVVGDVDHRALLPRVRAAIHHGGSGTTHAVAAAGRPQLVVPRLGDQPHYGRQVHRAGLGPAAVWHTRASSAVLARSLTSLLEDPARAQVTAAAAATMATENGLARAVRELTVSLPHPGRVVAVR